MSGSWLERFPTVYSGILTVSFASKRAELEMRGWNERPRYLRAVCSTRALQRLQWQWPLIRNTSVCRRTREMLSSRMIVGG